MKNLIIYLGSKCNLNCPYCHREVRDNEGSVSSKLLDFIKGKKFNISFRGGEPLLYMSDIKSIVESSPDSKYTIVTNGVLVNDCIDFFKEHNFNVNISFDGNSVRGYNPFNNLSRDYHYGIVSAISHGNVDLDSIFKEFDKLSLSLGYSVSFYPHIIHYTNEINREYALTESEYNSLYIQYVKYITKYVDSIRNYGVMNNRYRGLYLSIRDLLDNNYSYGETVCANEDTIRLDMNGSRYNCSYIRDVELNMDDYIESQIKVIESISSKCRGCKVYDMCGAGCLKSLYHDKECSFKYKLYSWFRDYYNSNREVLERYES